jgi:glycosyltransferase involved in cell wall biosynthesis
MKVCFNTYPWAFDTPGGGERQMQFYRAALLRGTRRWPSLSVERFDMWNPGFREVNLLHFFSCMPGTKDFLSYSKEVLRIPLVVSPNFWPDPEGWKKNGTDSAIKSILWLADIIVVNSYIEEDALCRLCKIDSSKIRIVPNAVENCFFDPVSPDLFRDAYEIHGPFVLNVANVEPRKNQLAFLKSLKAFPDLQLITIGGVRESWYLDACKEEGGEQFRLVEPLPPGSEMLRSAMAGCEFFAMPSLRETPSIASLEAGAAGARILTTELGSPAEYFKQHAVYVDPYNLDSMRESIEAVLARPRGNALSERIRRLYRWDVVVESLVNCYSEVLGVDLMADGDGVHWRLEGPFDSTYSLAIVNRELARALDDLGVDVALFSTEGPGDFAPSRQFLENNHDLARMNARARVAEHAGVSAVSRNLYPPRVEDMRCRVNLLHSYAWEESAFPAQWVRNFNAHLSGIVCTSAHVKKVLRDNGVRIPMAVSGNGVDHWERIEASSISALDSLDAKPFRFLHVSSFFPRKGPDALLEAWGRAFTDRDDVCLVIKTFSNPHNRVHEQLAAMRERYPAYPQIIVIEDDLSDADLKALYSRCQALVAPSCAEGFGLPLAEAMLGGLPVIATGWSGQMDFCSPENSWLVDYRFEQADTHFKLLPSAWAAIDVDALAAAMKSAYGAGPSERQAKAQNGREKLLKEFGWRKVAERLLDFYESLQTPPARKPETVGWISTWNTRCGIAAYSSHLMAGFKRQPYVLAPRSGDLVKPDAENCERCWNAGDDDDLAELSRAIDARNIDIVVIQWNFGFFHHDHFHGFMRRQKEAGRTVVVDMHATNDPPQAAHKKLANYIPALALADRLLMHSINDMNRLKSFGLVENLTLFPLGMLEAASVGEAAPPSAPTIATYGFCLPHKGLEQIVDAVGLLRDAGERVDLVMVNAEYPVDVSARLVQSLRNRIDELGLGERITLETRFLPDAESLALLQSADLVLFAYHPTSESASAAVRHGLSSGKPVMTTDLPIFAEFGEAVWRAADNSPGLLAHSIREALAEIRADSPEHRRRQQLADSWRAQHGYSWLAERLEGMLRGLYLDSSISE